MAGVALSDAEFERVLDRADGSRSGRVYYKDFVENMSVYVVCLPCCRVHLTHTSDQALQSQWSLLVRRPLCARYSDRCL